MSDIMTATEVPPDAAKPSKHQIPSRVVAPALTRSWPGAAAVALILLLWELLSRVGVLEERYIPSASATFGELGDLAASSTFWVSVGGTLQGWSIGLAVASLLSIPIAFLVGSNKWVYRSLRFPIEFLRPIPAVSLIPVALLIYGIGIESKVFLAAFGSFWPLFIQTIYGVHDVDPVLVDTAKSFGLTRWERIIKIKVPSAVPFMLTGLRISSSVALILAVTAELIIGSSGLGRDLNTARASGALEQMYALIIATGLLGLVMNLGMTWLERRSLRWHPSQRKASL